jgi:murein DD-endopeptidase MepM/ murein hydrolase activator NlpD
LKLISATLVVCLAASLPPAFAAVVSNSALSRSANEQTCRPGPQASRFEVSSRQVFLWFLASRVAASDRISVEWVEPAGAVELRTDWGDLPAAASLCFLTQLPLAGFDAAAKPGRWTARILVNGAIRSARSFDLAPDPNAGRIHVARISKRVLDAGRIEVVAEGVGFDSTTILHVAQYTPAGGWRFLAVLRPESVEARKLTAVGPMLPPGEYMILAANGSLAPSAPARLLIATDTGYRLPTPAGEPWVLTQGPYGSFSHFNRSLHAYDIAPVGGRCIVAMRGGTVHAFDGGFGQTPRLRIFGNYITIAHDNGEFSHYGHLKTGTFLVRTGQRIERGQALAEVGNSGFTLGAGGGHHVHVHVTRSFSISAQSIPVEFEDLPDWRYRGTIRSGNDHPDCDCRSASPAQTSRARSKPAQRWEAQVAVSERWTDLLRVPAGTNALDLALSWEGASRDFDLQLVSPRGHVYGRFADSAPLAAPSPNGLGFVLSNPDPGLWRVVVTGIRGAGERMRFVLETGVPRSAGSPRNP